MIDANEAIQRILADKIDITPDLLAVGADKAVYEAINASCDRHARMLKEMATQSNTPNTLKALDCISRQDAIDALLSVRKELDEYLDDYLKDFSYALRSMTKAERNRIDEDIKIIKGLPSAHPTQSNTSNTLDALDCLNQQARRDLISRLSDLRSQYNLFDENEQDAYHTLTEAIAVLNGLPFAQPERKKGKWIRDAVWFTRYHCSQCGEKTEDTIMGEPRYQWCPMCGADMRTSEDK